MARDFQQVHNNECLCFMDREKNTHREKKEINKKQKKHFMYKHL